MVARVSVRGKAAVFAVLGLTLALSGCQSGNPLGGLDMGGQQEPPANRITADELLAYCPVVSMRQNNAVLDSYQRGGDGDPSKLIYRASISDSTRACTYNGGMMSMTVAVAGRVIPGPAGATGNVQLPLRLTVYRDNEMIEERTLVHPVTVVDTAGATQFVLTDTSITMPNPQARNIRVLVGFGESAR